MKNIKTLVTHLVLSDAYTFQKFYYISEELIIPTNFSSSRNAWGKHFHALSDESFRIICLSQLTFLSFPQCFLQFPRG